MTTHEKAIELVRRQVTTVLVLRNALALLTAWGFVWGVAILALRAMVGVPRLPLLWGLAVVPVAIAIALALALRRLPSAGGIRAMLDRCSGAGGLLMAAEEKPLGAWQERMPLPVLPTLHWQAHRSWALAGLAGGFVLLCFAIPQRYTELGRQALEIGPELDRLTRQIDVLKEEAILEPARAEALEKKLSQLRDESSGKDPVKTLEAVDHVKDVATKAAQKAAEQAARKKERLAETETAADLLRKKSKNLTPKQMAKGMAELAVLTRKAAAEAALTKKHLNSSKLQAALEGKLSADELKDLLDALGDSKEELDEMLDKLKIVGLIDAECCGKCKGAGDMKDLEAFLNTHPNFSECLDGKGGVGGTTRGPGPASLDMTNNTKDEELKLKPQALPPGALAAKKSQLKGLSKAAPQVGKKDEPAQSGALAGAATDGGSANSQVVLPRHRSTVSRYFERQ